MKIILVRHGQSEANAAGIRQGSEDNWTDTQLSEKGINQVKKLAERLKDEKFDKIYSSNLKRAIQTAEEINKYHDKKIIIDKRLADALNKETSKDIIKKCKSFLKNILKEDKTILIIAHGSINLTIMALLTTKNKEEGGKFVKETSQHNTAVNIIEKENGEFKLKLINDISHRDDKVDINSKWETR
ncbi:MAG: histidine phosphatase family protein [Nanoarchaeota archaeon]